MIQFITEQKEEIITARLLGKTEKLNNILLLRLESEEDEEEKTIKFVYVMKNGIMMRVPEEVAKTMDCDKPKSVRKINVSNKI